MSGGVCLSALLLFFAWREGAVKIRVDALIHPAARLPLTLTLSTEEKGLAPCRAWRKISRDPL